jgi:hypothetical protein
VPSKPKTRKSISVRGATYNALRVYSSLRAQSMSDVLEQLLAPVLQLPVPSKEVKAPLDDLAGIDAPVPKRGPRSMIAPGPRRGRPPAASVEARAAISGKERAGMSPAAGVKAEPRPAPRKVETPPRDYPGAPPRLL